MITPSSIIPTPLNFCVPNALGFVECDSGHSTKTGSVLVAGSYDFSGVIVDPYWALGFSSLGNAYPNQTNIEQAYYYSSLQVYPSDLPQLSATEVQFNDQYETESGLVQTKWTIAFDHANKIITVGNPMTKLQQTGAWRAVNEILLNFWRLDSFSFPVPPQAILLPYT